LNDQDFESIFVVKDDEVHVPNYMALKKKKEDEMNDKRRFCSFAFFKCIRTPYFSLNVFSNTIIL
jgi:hypothetical protein